MIKAVIFDLDGVIVSTDELHFQAWKKLADRENIPFDETINHKLRGISRNESLEIILQNATQTYTDTQKQEMATYKNELYKELLPNLNETDILPGILTILDTLKEKGLRVAIGSSSKNAKPILRRIGLFNSFEVISDGTNIVHSKPNPEVFIKAAQMMNLSNSECAVVEDAISGIQAAKACNMLTFAVGDAKKSPLKDHDFVDILNVL